MSENASHAQKKKKEKSTGVRKTAKGANASHCGHICTQRRRRAKCRVQTRQRRVTRPLVWTHSGRVAVKLGALVDLCEPRVDNCQ